MSLLSFFFGKEFAKNKETIKHNPGAIYLDTGKHELWYDDPDSSDNSNLRHQIIDTTALAYQLDDDFYEIVFNDTPASGATTAKLGVAKLGSMVLGMD